LENVVLEGNNARVILHKRTVECTTIFKQVIDLMGLISWSNQTLEDLRLKIQSLNDEATKALDPLEQQEKYDKIHQLYNDMNTLFKTLVVAKKELREF